MNKGSKGVIIFLLLVIIGILVFFLWIKPNFIDETDEVKAKTDVDLYYSYLKEELKEDEVLYISLIDLNDDNNYDLIITDGKTEIEFDVVRDGEVVTIPIDSSLVGEFKLYYDSADSKTRWYFVVGNWANPDFYDINDAIEAGRFKNPETFKNLDSILTHASLDSNITYVKVDKDSVKDELKKMSKKYNYKTGKTIDDAKDDIKEFNTPKDISCTQPVTTDGKFSAHLDKTFHFENNKLEYIDFNYYADFSKSPKEVDIEKTVQSYKKIVYDFHGKNPTVTKKSSTLYVLETRLPKSEFYRMGEGLDNYTFDDFKAQNALGFEEGMTCEF